MGLGQSGGISAFFCYPSDGHLLWLGTQFCDRTHPFERQVINSELEMLREFAQRQKPALKDSPQLALF
jgi:hypothetical protein